MTTRDAVPSPTSTADPAVIGTVSARPARLAGLVAAACAALSVSTEPRAETLSDVVVSATRGEQRSFDAPASIQGVTQETLREAGPQINLSESLNRVPGVVVLNRQNYAQDLQLSIRGFGARSTFGIRGVRLLVDGIPATIPDGQGQASTISLPSAARIEVLRGPLAQLYGNAAGGVVQVFTRDGPAQPELGADAWFGSYGTRRYGLSGGGQAGALNYYADYSTFETDGYRAHGAAERKQLNAKLRYDLSPSTRFTLVGNFFDQPTSQDPAGLSRAQLTADRRQAGTNAIAQNAGKSVSQNQLGLVAEHAINADNRFTARVYYGQRELDSRLTVPLGAQQANTSAGGIIKLDRDYAGVGLQYSNRTRLAQGVLTSTVGIDYDRAKDARLGYINNAGVQGALKRDEDNTFSSFDYFAQLAWAINPDWTLTGGVRRSTVKFEVDDRFIQAGTPVNPNDSGSVDYSATNPVLGITRHLSESVNLYANVGRGFETPTFTEIAYRNGGSGPNFLLAASRSNHAEVGVKARLGPDHRIDLALFTIRTDDELVVETNSGGRSTFKNAGRTQRDGVELSYTGRLSRDFTTLVALTTLNARFKDSFTGSSGAVAAGNKLPGVPDRFLYGELAWRPAMSGWLTGLNAGIELVHAGKLYVNDTNSDSAAGYTIFNLRAGLEQRVGAWRFREFVRLDNVGDRDYVASVIVNDANGRYFEPAPGRTWLLGVSAAYTFR